VTSSVPVTVAFFSRHYRMKLYVSGKLSAALIDGIILNSGFAVILTPLV